MEVLGMNNNRAWTKIVEPIEDVNYLTQEEVKR